jgi:hypothetical protein
LKGFNAFLVELKASQHEEELIAMGLTPPSKRDEGKGFLAQYLKKLLYFETKPTEQDIEQLSNGLEIPQ